MESHDTPYVWRDEAIQEPEHDPEERDTVIVDGLAMSYRHYRHTEDTDDT